MVIRIRHWDLIVSRFIPRIMLIAKEWDGSSIVGIPFQTASARVCPRADDRQRQPWLGLQYKSADAPPRDMMITTSTHATCEVAPLEFESLERSMA